MPSLIRVLPAVALLVVVAAACSGPVASPSATALPSGSPVESASASAAAGPNILPILISSEILAGQNRFLFSLTDRTNKLIAAPDVPVSLEFYDVAADENAVAFTADARFIWGVQDLKGLYVADVEFPRAGRWGTRFTATLPDGRVEQVRADYDVAATGSTPAIGAAAVSIDTPTLADTPDGDIERLSSDTTPDPRFYETSIADALAARAPFVVAFATPAFCQTAMCGPMLEGVKAAADAYPGLTFINVEPYKMSFTEGRLQPELDASGNLQAATWTDAWGLRTEPWIFVVDGEGKVTAKFEAAVADEEFRAALDAATPKEGRASGLVIAVDQPELTRVDSFTLRTDTGEELVFAVGKLDLSGGGFNAGHLREHMATSTRVAVDYTMTGSARTATRLTDAE